MFKTFFYSKKWLLWAYLGGVFLLTSLYAQVYMSVLINAWFKGFYDLLQNAQERQISEFWNCIETFLWIVIPYVLLATLTSFIARLYAFRWREAITFDYLPKWLNVKKDIEGSSQRIQEDVYRFTKLIESLGLDIIRAGMTIVAFMPILWVLSEEVNIPLFGIFPGSLVYIVLMTSVGGMIISWFVGIKLPGLEYNNQVVEAAFRKELVYGEDDKKKYCSPAITGQLFKDLKNNYHKLFFHYGYFDCWSNTYYQLMVIVPFVVVCPTLFSGAITLGYLMQVSNAFDEVRQGLTILIRRWVDITELRSIFKRLREFESKL